MQRGKPLRSSIRVGEVQVYARLSSDNRAGNPAGADGRGARWQVIALSHHTAPVHVRELLAVPEAEWQAFGAELCGLPGAARAEPLSKSDTPRPSPRTNRARPALHPRCPALSALRP